MTRPIPIWPVGGDRIVRHTVGVVFGAKAAKARVRRRYGHAECRGGAWTYPAQPHAWAACWQRLEDGWWYP